MSLKETLSSVRGELGSMYLQGLNDLHNSIVPAFPESQRGIDQMGTPLNPTSQMVTRDVDPSAATYEYAHESDRALDAMVDKAAESHREQEMERERE